MIFSFYLASEFFVIPGYLVLKSLLRKNFPLMLCKVFGLLFVSVISLVVSLFLKSPVQITFFFILILVTIISFGAFKAQKLKFGLPKNSLRNYIALTLVSFLIYMFLNYIRTFKPEIMGTEKFMDVALINTILKQDQMPIENPWYSGFLMNYYYLGQYIIAMLCSISLTTVGVGYNLGISLIGVLTFQMFFVFIFKFARSPFWSYLFALTATFGGNIYLYYEQIFLHKQPWFADATRVIPLTINEFPSYSIILGDLHGHYLSLPFFIMALYFVYVIWRKINNKATLLTLIKYGIIFGVTIGALYLINSWDVISLVITCLCFVILSFFLFYKKFQTNEKLIALGKQYGVLLIAIGTISFSIFWYSRNFFTPAVTGIGINTDFSNPFFFLVLFGHFLAIALIIAGIISLVSLTFFKSKKRTYQFSFLSLFAVIAVVLIVMVEFFYAKDIFSVLNVPNHRTNTVFKFYYHAWAYFSVGLFSLLGIGIKALEKSKNHVVMKLLPVGMTFLVCMVMLSYFTIGVTQFLNPKYFGVSVARLYSTPYLDGYVYMMSHDHDKEILSFLQNKPYTTILEHVDYNSYSYGARFSSYSGHTAIQGWPLHNVQWYGGYKGIGILKVTSKKEEIDVAQRVKDIEIMYSSTDVTTVKSLLRKYRVKYVIFGEKEMAKIATLEKENKYAPYDNICTVVWSKDDARIYQCQ